MPFAPGGILDRLNRAADIFGDWQAAALPVMAVMTLAGLAGAGAAAAGLAAMAAVVTGAAPLTAGAVAIGSVAAITFAGAAACTRKLMTAAETPRRAGTVAALVLAAAATGATGVALTAADGQEAAGITNHFQTCAAAAVPPGAKRNSDCSSPAPRPADNKNVPAP